MELGFAVFLIFVTSIFGYGILRRVRPLSTTSLFKAIATLLEWAGLFTLFLGANLIVGLLFIFAIRTFTPRFVSLYQLESLFLLILSGAQAFVFHQWFTHA
jgi:hypothetical protein